MKTALLAGVFLLALSFTIADALDKKQGGCTVTDEFDACLDAGRNNNIGEFCSSSCRSALMDCLSGDGLDSYNQLCGSAATVGVTLFTVVSALLVAVIGN